MLRSVIMERMGRPRRAGRFALASAVALCSLRLVRGRFSPLGSILARPSLLISLSLPPSPAGSGVQQEQTVQRLHRRRLGEDKWSCCGD